MFLKRLINRWQVCLLDTALIPCAWFGAYWLSYNLAKLPSAVLWHAASLLPLVLTVQLFMYFAFSIPDAVWRFTSHRDFLKIVEATLVSTASILIFVLVTHRVSDLTRSTLPLYAILLIGLQTGLRTLYRVYYENHLARKENNSQKRVLIIGAGQAGEHLLREIQQDLQGNYTPVAFVDDLKSKQWRSIRGIKVVGRTQDIPSIVKRYDIDLLFIAIPSIGSSAMRRIISYCEQATVPFRTLPRLRDLAKGNISQEALREVQLEDILGRDPVELEHHKIQKEINGKCVVITGAGGSIGSELCAQIAKLNPSCLVVLENNEFNLYKLDFEIQAQFKHIPYHSYLCDVKHISAVAKILREHQPDFVFHAAAYKHVPILESQIVSAVFNNLIGTKVMAELSAEAGVDTFVLISTDKAVNPSNVMGATKRAAEVFCQNFGRTSKTKFITVRFGNVLGSTGSVIPLFKDQIASGGPVTVTHPDVTRYFMTIPEACQLILQAKVLGDECEIFVLEMGEPVKINYLAEQMIRLSGLNPYNDIDIQYIGLRPGEKLHEELFHNKEQLIPTEHAKIMRAKSRIWDQDQLMKVISQVEIACAGHNSEQLQVLLKKLVPEWNTEEACKIYSPSY